MTFSTLIFGQIVLEEEDITFPNGSIGKADCLLNVLVNGSLQNGNYFRLPLVVEKTFVDELRYEPLPDIGVVEPIGKFSFERL